MPQKLSQEEIVTLHVLVAKGQPNTRIAKTLGVSEGTVRYHARRQAKEAVDGRKNKARKAEPFAEVIDHWIKDHDANEKRRGSERPVNVQDLFDYLRVEFQYRGSYKSILRFVRARYPRPRLRTYRRIETPPGAQGQVDWGEFRGIDIGDGPQRLNAFVMVLSHSRRPAVIWSLRMDQLAWLHVHNEALARLGGIPAVMRIDNLKTGVSKGAGPWGVINTQYEKYAWSVGFHVDPCLPGAPEDKGKVERKVKDLRALGLYRRRFEGLEDLQAWTDEQIELLCRERTCPATGKSVEESWLEEIPYLKAIGILPEVFDVVVNRRVWKDATVNFEGRTYSVPFTLSGLTIEVRGCARSVQFLHQGEIVAEHPRLSRERLLINPDHYEGCAYRKHRPTVFSRTYDL